MNAHKLSAVKHLMSRISAAGVPHTPGIYILYRANLGPPHWVGRSDSDLHETLVGFKTKEAYPYFKFMQCKNADDAFQWECIYWHQGRATLDNGEMKGGHQPHRPKGSQVQCPVPGCTHNFDTVVPAREEIDHEKESVEEIQRLD